MPPLVVREDHVLVGVHEGSVYVEAGRFELVGVLQGSLHLSGGAPVFITGTHQGSLHVSARSLLTVSGAVQGSTHVESDAEVIVESGGKLAGSLHNDGQVLIRGVFGGTKFGLGSLVFESGGYEKMPTRSGDGTRVYDW